MEAITALRVFTGTVAQYLCIVVTDISMGGSLAERKETQAP
jgi:hypothetical protein